MEQTNHQALQHTGIKPKRGISRFAWLYKSLDAVMTAPLNAKERKRDLVKSVFQKKSSNYNRVSAFLNLLDGLMPGIAKKTASSLLRVKHFPFAGFQVSLLAYGSGATVFLLEEGSRRKILKVFRRSLGKTAQEALQVAQEYQEKHHLLSSWFNGQYQIVVPSQYLLLHGPLLGGTSAAIIQPYIDEEKFDLFLDFTIEEAERLAQEDIHFQNQLLDFSRRLFAVVEEKGLCFDLVGRENLMLIETMDGVQLKIVDNGIFDLNKIREQSPVLHARIMSHLEHLRAIQERLETIDQRREY